MHSNAKENLHLKLHFNVWYILLLLDAVLPRIVVDPTLPLLSILQSFVQPSFSSQFLEKSFKFQSELTKIPPQEKGFDNKIGIYLRNFLYLP